MANDSTLTSTEAAFRRDAGVGEQASTGVESNGERQVASGIVRSVDGEAWAWATEHGAPQRATTEQLVSWLARGELLPHTLVWKPGWGEWLPAMQVAELAAAFPSVTPGSRRVARGAPDAFVRPPPVPLAHYPRLRLLAKDVLSDAPAVPSTDGSQGHSPAQAARRALRDPDHVQQDVVTSQVPVAAMLERARAMKRQLPPGGAERAARPHFGTFGDPAPQHALGEQKLPTFATGGSSSTPPHGSLAPLALELGFPTLLEPEPAKNLRRTPRRYGRWLVLGTLVGSALGLISLRAQPPDAAAPAPSRAETSATETTAIAQLMAEPIAEKQAAVVEPKPESKPAVLRAVRAAEKDSSDRVVFEFRERVPSYHLAYIDQPARDCATGNVRPVAGRGRLEVRFDAASAHTESGKPSVAQRELKPALSMVREVERTCDFEGVVTWVIGTASRNRYRAFELASPARLVVVIDH